MAKKLITKKGNKRRETAENADEKLMELLGTEKKRRPPAKLIILAAGAAAVCGIAAFIIINAKSKAASEEVTYREYTVERGDITVGETESSSISLNRNVITFPVSTTVEEVYVKAGSYVQEGDPLMKLNADEIATGLADYELELEEAGLAVEQAKLNQTKGELEAQQKYESAKLSGDLAEQNETLSLAELEQSYKAAVNSLNQAQENYQSYVQQYYEDYCELNSLYNAISSAKSIYYAAQDSLTSYLASMQTKIDAQADAATQKQEEIAKAKEAGIDTTDLETALANINAEKAELEAELESGRISYDSAVASAEQEYESAESSYEKAAETYEKNYGSLTYNTDYNTNIENLKLNVEKAALSLQKSQLSIDTGTQSAEQKTESAKTEAKAASTEKELTETELQQYVDSAQNSYDALETEIEKIKARIGDDGIVYATCTGMVAAVALEAGDSFEVKYNTVTQEVVEQTLVTITDISGVYVPITISEEDILDVSIGQEAAVTMTAFPDQTFEAEVDSMSVESSRSGAATVSYTVNVRFKGTNTLQMLEGMSAEVTLIEEQAKDVLYINASCVNESGGKSTVLVWDENGNAVEREVVTGITDGRYIEIKSGLSEGETVLSVSGGAAAKRQSGGSDKQSDGGLFSGQPSGGGDKPDAF